MSSPPDEFDNLLRSYHPALRHRVVDEDSVAADSTIASTLPDHFISVSQLSAKLKLTLESTFPNIRFKGELSGVRASSAGHLYFTVKDPDALKPVGVQAVMWRGSVGALTFSPEDGAAVKCIGTPNIYPADGRLQIVVKRMEPAGEGTLLRRFRDLQARLSAEGVFDVSRKRALPFLPKGIGVVTSGGGAVIHDIMVKLAERMPQIPVYLADVKVQGEGAVREIVDGIKRLDDSRLVDVIIVARGGGSLQDLWAFNEEDVVRAVFAAKTPIVSGVGHETDVTLCDYVADVRAPTPTAAAELVVPRRELLLDRISDSMKRLDDLGRWLFPMVQRVEEAESRLVSGAQARLSSSSLLVSRASARVACISPASRLSLAVSRVERSRERLSAAEDRCISTFGRRLDLAVSRLERSHPAARTTRCLEAVDSLFVRLGRAVRVVADRKSASVLAQAHRLEGVGPYRVLERGYALIESDMGIVSSCKNLPEGGNVAVRFGDGRRFGKLFGVSADREQGVRRDGT